MSDDRAIVPAAGDGAAVPAVHLGSLPVAGPHDLVAQARDVAKELAQVVTACDLAVDIRGRRYVRVEGWTTCAAMLGVTAREVSAVELEDGSYAAVVELARVSDGQLIGRGSAVCGLDEPAWADRPRFARRSMAVTRATGKACRLAFSWIMTLAGFAETAAEEVEGADVGGRQARRRPRPAAQDLRPRVLGSAGAKRLAARLQSAQRSYAQLLAELEAHHRETWELVRERPIEEIPEAAWSAIAAVFRGWEQNAAESSTVHISEEEIPF